MTAEWNCGSIQSPAREVQNWKYQRQWPCVDAGDARPRPAVKLSAQSSPGPLEAICHIICGPCRGWFPGESWPTCPLSRPMSTAYSYSLRAHPRACVQVKLPLHLYSRCPSVRSVGLATADAFPGGRTKATCFPSQLYHCSPLIRLELDGPPHTVRPRIRRDDDRTSCYATVFRTLARSRSRPRCVLQGYTLVT